MQRPLPHSVRLKRVLATFPATVRELLHAALGESAMLPAESTRQLSEELGLDLEPLMIRLLPLAQTYAVVPISHYEVGVVVAGLTARGQRWPALYFGANYEIAGAALSFTVHAEQSAVNNAWLHGETGLSALAVTAAPCGYCRQFLHELASAERLRVILPMAGKKRAFRAAPLREFLPHAFGPLDLGIRGGLMNPKLAAPELRIAKKTRVDELAAAALDAARRSYAPYPTDRAGQFSGVALELASGRIITGRYAANAAYNPSLSPLESALAFAHLNVTPGTAQRIQRCALVEVPTLASQRSATEAVLAAVAPKVSLEYFAAQPAE